VTRAYRIYAVGIVQGVGFRPYVKMLADRLGVSGYVKNLGGGEVEIYVEGGEASEFMRALLANAPPVIRLEEVRVEEVEPLGAAGFRIEGSEMARKRPSMIPPDLAICDDCLREVLESGGERRRDYPFNSCSFCGPRFSIIAQLPYDRENTSWRAFPMCHECEREYGDPLAGGVRRYYYQGISCRRDGPRVRLLDRRGAEIQGGNPIAEAARLIDGGHIVAVKGVGGYHIMALATDGGVVAELRKRKRRPQKPFAVMALSVDVARRLAHVDGRAAELLTSPQRPIVLLPKRDDSPVSPLVSPGLDMEGVFLPYTPLQYLLLAKTRDKFVIATSGNVQGEPMCYTLSCVLEKLGRVVDYVLDHGLEIVHRVDDSVMRFTDGEPVMIRRGRGYAPAWIRMRRALKRHAVAFGGDLQTAGAIGVEDKAVLTQYIGDLDSFEAYEYLDRELRWFASVYGVREPVLACDKNPAYRSVRLCREWAEELGAEVFQIQHHHAHALAAAADLGVDEPFVAIAIDGVGYGEDGSAWGGEVLFVDGAMYERAWHLRYVPMPGGDLAAYRPARMAIAYLSECCGDAEELVERAARYLPGGAAELNAVMREVKSPRILTSSAGRFLDAVAVLLGVAWERTYEGEPAMKLEAAARGGRELETHARDQVELFGELVDYARREARQEDLAYTAQVALGRILGERACEAAESKGARYILLGGGAAVNSYIARGVRDAAARCGAGVLLPRRVPPGDGGLALGQIYFLTYTIQ
jgi:hydrogenase maturation protein HypF